MNVCYICFQDRELKRYIREQGERELCYFCDSRQICMDTSELKRIFLPLARLYEPVDEGGNWRSDYMGDHEYLTLAGNIQQDWSIFSDRLNCKTQDRILHYILGYHLLCPKEASMADRVTDFWMPRDKSLYRDSEDSLWSGFRYEVQHENRFFHDRERCLPAKWLQDFGARSETVVRSGTKLYRGRIHDGRLPITEMGAPPPTLATNGRANPAGIPVLYLAEHERTALKEVRAQVGQCVNVASFIANRDLKVLDLKTEHYFNSPFFHENLSVEVTWRRALRLISKDLRKPVTEEQRVLEYLPTQVVAQIAQDLGYAGIRYGSAQDQKGTNFVFFRPSDFRPHRCRLRTVVPQPEPAISMFKFDSPIPPLPNLTFG